MQIRSTLKLVCLLACCVMFTACGGNGGDLDPDVGADAAVDAGGDARPDVGGDADAGDVDGGICPDGGCADADICQSGSIESLEGIVALSEGIVSGDTSSAAGGSIGARCAGGENPAPEEIYRFELSERRLVRLSARATWGSPLDVVLSLRGDCLDPAGELVCHDERSGATAERLTRVLEAGTYFVVVQGIGEDNAGAYDLEFVTEPIVCTPGEARCAEQYRSRVCNVWGTRTTEIECAEGCDDASGQCQIEPGDACYRPIDATSGYRGAIDWALHRNDYDPQSGGCVPNNYLSMATDGPDVAYEVEVAGGHALRVQLKALEDYASLYIVRDCDEEAQSCAAGANNATVLDDEGLYREQLTYLNDTGVSQRFFVIADTGELAVEGTAEIVIELGAPSCEPLSRQCSGDEVNTCDAAGLSFQTERTCAFGCNPESLSCNPLANDACKGAVDLSASDGSYTGYIERYVDDFDPGADGCTGAEAPGADAVFAVQAQPGDLVTVTLDASFDASLWVTSDCSRAAQRCVVGSARDGASFETVQFEAPRGGTYFVVVDSKPGASGEFRVNARIDTTPSCSPGDVLGCSTDRRLAFCSDQGLPLEYPCSTSCTDGACDLPRGDICHDAVELESGDTVSGSISGSNAIDPGTGMVGACDFGGYGGAGPDDIYRVEMQPGDILEGSINGSTRDISVYLLEDCNDGASCQTRVPAGVSVEPNVFVYQSDRAQTVFLVVDYAGTNTTALSYTLGVALFSQTCVPGETQCSNDGSALEVCNAYGIFDRFRCDGGCTQGACQMATGDMCADAIAMQSGDVINGGYGPMNAVDPGKGQRGSCWFGVAPDGPEKIHEISLAQGETLTAKLVDVDSASVLYLLSDCDQTDSCLANTSRGGTLELNYTAPQAETVYLVVDRTRNSDSSYRLSVSTQMGTCTPGELSCLADGKSLGLCTSQGLYDPVVCSTTCTAGVCDTPAGDVCFDAIPLQSGDSVTGDFGGTDQLDPGPGQVGSCRFEDEGAPGRDTIYSVDMSAGQILDARLSAEDEKTWMYLLEDCDAGASCLASSATDRLHYEATVDETVYLVVDRSMSNRFPSTSFQLDVLVQAPSCTPGQASCADAQTLAYCDRRGLLRQFDCVDPATGSASSCSAGGCDTPSGDVCADAVVLSDGDSVSGTFGAFDALSVAPGFAGACWFAETTVGYERLYAVSLQAGDVLDVDVNSSSEDTVAYLLEDCLDAQSCLGGGSAAASQRLTYSASAPETVFLVVDANRYAQMAAETFQVDVAISTASCTPGDTRCHADGTTLQTCDTHGVWRDYACHDPVSGQIQSCVAGACSPKMGDVCADAIELVDGDVVTGSWQGTDAFDPPDATVGACDFTEADLGPTSSVGVGRDTVYAIDLQAGEALVARLDGGDESNWLMYLLEDCSDEMSCLAHTNAGYLEGKLTHQATDAETVYLVVDRVYEQAKAINYTLSVDVRTPSCTPGSTRCAQDGVTLEVCNEIGVYERFTCAQSCAQGACSQPSGEVCADAIAVSDGDSVTGDWDGSDSVRLGPGHTGACDFKGHETRGTDTVYRVDMQAGEVLTADLSAASQLNWPVMYLLDGCVNSGGSCLANVEPGLSASLSHRATSDGPVYLVVDSIKASDASMSYTLDIDVQTAGCTPGQTQCAADGTTLEACNQHQVWDAWPCNGTCTAGRCDNPAGDTCIDAIPLTDGDEFSGALADFTHALDPGTDSCIWDPNKDQIGREAAFAVELNAGDILEANLYVRASQVTMYVLDDCVQEPSQSCLLSGLGQKKLEFYAPETKTYYLVVDSHAAHVDDDFSVAVDIRSGACQPGGATCDGQTSALEVCDDDGTSVRATSTCASGCQGDVCAPQPAANDDCSSAQPVSTSTRIIDSFARFSDSHSPPDSALVGTTPLGPDAVYAVSLQAGESVVASVSGLRAPFVYILTDCNDDSSCVAGPGPDARTGYVASTSETVYLVVDTAVSGADTPFVLDIDIAPGECQPGQLICADADTLQRCSDYHRWKLDTCHFGCQAGACTPAPNDRCTTAIDATGGLHQRAPFSSFSDQYDPASRAPSCTGHGARGPDAIYSVDASKNEVIRAAVRSFEDAAVWITTDCSNPAMWCVAGADETQAMPEMVEYLAPQDGRYYVIVDSYWPGTSAEFSVDIALDPPSCAAAEATCLDSTTLSYCTNDGTERRDYACVGGCQADGCTNPVGDICPDAVPVSTSTTLTGDFTALGPEIDPGFGGCTGFEAIGPDAIYAVDIDAGQTMSATLRNTSASHDLSLYVVGDCTDAQNSCLDGSDAYGAVDETVIYTAAADETVYVVADSFEMAAGSFEIEFVLQ